MGVTTTGRASGSETRNRLGRAIGLAVNGDLEGAIREGMRQLDSGRIPLEERMGLIRMLIDWNRAVGDSLACKRLASRAVEVGTSFLGPCATEVLIARNSELYWMCEIGLDALAARRFPDLLRDVEEHEGRDSELAWAVRNNSAMPCKSQGDYAAAVAIYRDLVVDMAEVLDADDILLLTERDNLAEALALDGQFDEARLLYEGLLELVEAKWGSDDERAMRLRFEIARILFLMGEESEAVRRWEEIAVDAARALGPHHPRVFACRSILIAAALQLGDDEGAMRQCEALLDDPPPVLDALDVEDFADLLADCELRMGLHEGGA